MTKADFLKNKDVEGFIEWLSNRHEVDLSAVRPEHPEGKDPISISTIPVCLNIKKSRFVPKAINIQTTGIEGVLSHYTWKSTGMVRGDWVETKARLTALSHALRSAVLSPSNTTTLAACRDILEWGGNRDWAVGAYPFLNRMAAAGTLCDYIADTGMAFSLATADESALAPPTELMNAMLTKVHALYATDGLPIYDSRVAAAIASLVEMWRIDAGKVDTNLPPNLTFPATMRSRTVLRLFPHAKHSGVMTYGAPGTVAQWSSAKVRLAWIMEGVLTKLPKLFSTCCPTPSLADRMHAFEASLFIIGYDVTCLDCTLGGQAHPKYEKAFKSLNSPPALVGATKTITPLSGHGNPIKYSGTIDTGLDVIWGNLSFKLDPELIESIQSEFGGRHGVPLGASMTGSIPDDSLGQWIVNEGWTSPRYASAIAAILRAEGIISSFGRIGHGISLDF